MKGEDLTCECGAGAVDIDPGVTVNEFQSVSWHCLNGHLNISGKRPSFTGFQQMYFGTFVVKPEVPR